jgi:hypothetical protein
MKSTLRSHGRGAAPWPAVCAVLLCVALAGCGGSAPLFTRDGRPTTLVQCPAQGPSSVCTEHALAICGGEYDIVKQSTNNGMRNILFACKVR